jgi:hypothetical protein
MLLSCGGYACWLVTASAGEVRVIEASGPEQVVVETSDATAEEVLGALAVQFEFAIEDRAPPSQPIRYSGRLEGSLDDLLERMLRHQGYVIVRSAEARAGISSIVFLEAKEGAPPSAVGGAIAALKAKLQLQNQAKDSDEPGK